MGHPARFLSIAFAASLLTAAGAYAHVVNGRVVAVQDGDTLTVVDAKDAQHRIRIAGIDAPEKGQPFGDEARASLTQRTGGRAVGAQCGKRDRYGRDVCSVFIGTRDVGLEQVRSGYAWWYRDYAREQRPADRSRYAAAEEAAKEARRGLWRASDPIPPWRWRKARGSVSRVDVSATRPVAGGSSAAVAVVGAGD